MARSLHTATLLGDGKILVVGGDGDSAILSSAELYDPATNSWSAAGFMNAPRQLATATLLGDGKVLVTGGSNLSGPLVSTDLYDPAVNTWAATEPMAAARASQTATLLSNGKLLVPPAVVNRVVPPVGADVAACANPENFLALWETRKRHQ